MTTPTTPDETWQRWNEYVLRAVMRAAIPVNDPASRMAIQYAKEIAEFLGEFHLEIVPMSGHDPDSVRLLIEYMDKSDPKMGN